MNAPAYRIESLAYLRVPDGDGSRMISLGDWYAEDPRLALERLVARVGEVAGLLAEVDSSAARSLHEWISTEAGSGELLDQLRQGRMVSCVADGSEALYQFLVLPVPVTTALLRVVSSCA